MYCSQSLATYGGSFWKVKKGEGIIFLKNSKVVVATKFFSWWELIPNMPGMKSLKALLLSVMEQCGFLRPLLHHWYCVLIPWCFPQWIFSPHTPTWSPRQDLSFAYSLPFWDFLRQHLALGNQCQGKRKLLFSSVEQVQVRLPNLKFSL